MFFTDELVYTNSSAGKGIGFGSEPKPFQGIAAS